MKLFVGLFLGLIILSCGREGDEKKNKPEPSCEETNSCKSKPEPSTKPKPQPKPQPKPTPKPIQCKSNERLDQATGKCVLIIPQCKSDEILDTTTNTCKKKPEPPPPTCKEGERYDPIKKECVKIPPVEFPLDLKKFRKDRDRTIKKLGTEVQDFIDEFNHGLWTSAPTKVAENIECQPFVNVDYEKFIYHSVVICRAGGKSVSQIEMGLLVDSDETFVTTYDDGDPDNERIATTYNFTLKPYISSCHEKTQTNPDKFALPLKSFFAKTLGGQFNINVGLAEVTHRKSENVYLRPTAIGLESNLCEDFIHPLTKASNAKLACHLMMEPLKTIHKLKNTVCINKNALTSSVLKPSKGTR